MLKIMSDLLNRDMPELPEIEEEEDQRMPEFDAFKPMQRVENLTIFDDEDTRAFYEDLPNLKAKIPAVSVQICVYIVFETI